MTEPADMPGDSPAAKFLGPAAASGGPLELLGVAPEACNDEGIVRALQQRLSEVAAHPQGNTPEADEVRLALHAAAAQLLDPSVRGHLLSAKGKPTPITPRSDREQNEGSSITGDVVLELAREGGWTRDSMHRVSQLAMARGAKPQDLMRAVRTVSGGVPDVAQSETIQEPALAPEDMIRQRAARLGPGVLVAIIVGAVAASALLVILLTSLQPGGGASENAGAADATDTANPQKAAGGASKEQARELFPTPPRNTDAPEAAAGPQPGNGEIRAREWGDVLRDLSRAATLLDSDADQARGRFADVLAELSVRWVDASPDELTAAQSGVIEYLYRSGSNRAAARDAAALIAEPLTALENRSGPDEIPATATIAASAWAAGMCARLSGETNLPTDIAAGAARRLGAGLLSSADAKPAFSAGAGAALREWARRLSARRGPPDQALDRASLAAWGAWVKAVKAADGRDSASASRAMLLALDGLMTEGQEPSESRAVFDAITMLAAGLTWRDGEESRLWLMRWFDAARVSSGDLHALTSALAGQSSAGGVDLSMVLSPFADASQRAELRDRFASMWNLSGVQARSEAVSKWVESARGWLSQSPEENPVRKLARAVEGAKLAASAELVWAGEAVSADDLSPALPETLARLLNDVAPRGTFAQAKIIYERSGWAVQYQAAGTNIPARRELLARFPGAPLAPECEVVAGEAVRGSPQQVRSEAREVVKKHSKHAPMINALLELAPFMPATRDNSELIEHVTRVTLPSPREASWRIEVRRALVETLLQILAGRGEMSAVDELADELGVQFLRAVGRPRPAGDTKADPAEAARLLRTGWQRAGAAVPPSGREPISAAELETRRASRERVAEGPILAFIAEQQAVVELMSFVIVAERPDRAERVGAVIEKLERERLGAVHAFEQAEAAQRAAVELWLIRMGGEPA